MLLSKDRAENTSVMVNGGEHRAEENACQHNYLEGQSSERKEAAIHQRR
jgi:hypothetical protein